MIKLNMMNNKNLNGLSRRIRSVLYVFFIALLVILNSCVSNEVAESGDVNQDKIYMSYNVFHDAERDHDYSVTAQFRFGGSKGTTLILTAPSNIMLNGDKMNMQTSGRRGCWYESTLPLDSKEAEFVFTDTEANKLKNSFKLNSIDLKPLLKIDLDARKTRIAWEGEKLDRAESLSLEIVDEEGNLAYIDGGVKGSKDIVIKRSDLDGLVPGKAEIRVSRHSNENLKEKTSEGGSYRFEYKSQMYPVVLVSKKKLTEGEE